MSRGALGQLAAVLKSFRRIQVASRQQLSCEYSPLASVSSARGCQLKVTLRPLGGAEGPDRSLGSRKELA